MYVCYYIYKISGLYKDTLIGEGFVCVDYGPEMVGFHGQPSECAMFLPTWENFYSCD